MKYIFKNIVTNERLVRETADDSLLEENWIGNVIDGWALILVRSRWIKDGKLSRFVDIFEVMSMPEEEKAQFYWDIKKEKKNLKLEMMEESYEGEGSPDCVLSADDFAEIDSEIEKEKASN